MAGKHRKASRGFAGHANQLDDEVGVDVEGLSARLRFNPDDAHIWLEDERMVLLHLTAFSGLRRELIETLGYEATRKLLQRFGSISGTLDAAIAKRAMPHAGPIEAFKTGPRLHSLEGIVAPEEVQLEIDPETGLLSGEWIWRNSAEAEAHVEAFGFSAEPVCWTLVGYASAYSSAFIGHNITYREIECRAMGAPHCRTVGRPTALWGDSEGSADQIGIELPAIESRGAPLHQRISGAQNPSSDARDWLIGESSAFAALMATIRRIAPTPAPVLILGEPGVGKKSLGRAVHKFSNRSARPLLIVSCQRRDDADLELDLFGRERLGELPMRVGKLERLNGGTLLLEDVQSISPRIQAKLLQLLTEGTAERQAGGQPRQIDVRIIACANEGLAEAVRNGTFRQDLYHRLSICPVVVPPLRDRRPDLPLLIRHFAERHAARHGRNLSGLTVDAVSYLLNHEYPGNITELEVMIERAVILAPEGSAIRNSHLVSPADLNKPSFFRLSEDGALIHSAGPDDAIDIERQSEQLLRGQFNLHEFEAELIRRAVSQSSGNLSQAARLLGITRAQLAYRFARLEDEQTARPQD